MQFAAAPIVALKERLVWEQGQDLDELVVLLAEGAELLVEGREELSLEALPEVEDVSTIR
jgi:predicted RNase H-like HicB family nuclease